MLQYAVAIVTALKSSFTHLRSSFKLSWKVSKMAKSYGLQWNSGRFVECLKFSPFMPRRA